MPRLCSKTVNDAKVVDPLTWEFFKKTNSRAAIQSDTEWDFAKAAESGVKVLYYEVHIASLEKGGDPAVGIATAEFSLTEVLPGWQKGSFGYHGGDGMKFLEGGLTQKFGPKFGQDDIIGAGVDVETGGLFFTKNGTMIDVAVVVDLSLKYFPTVGVNRKAKLIFNFDGPFKFSSPPDRPFNVPAPVQAPVQEKRERSESIAEIKDKHADEKPSENVPPLLVPAPTPAPAQLSWAPKSKEHIMISYNWGAQDFVKTLYKELIARGFVVWMDIEGGMKGDIYQSMAEGVEGAVVFIPVLSAKYMASPNCRRECTAATDMGKTIIPIMYEMIEQSGWLRACIAGRLWYPCDNRKMDDKAMANFIEAVDKQIPANSPARKPNLSIYISYHQKNQAFADTIKEKLEQEKPPYTCIMSAIEKLGQGLGSKEVPPPEGTSGTTPREDGKKGDGKLKKSAALEEKLRNAKAVILIITNEFETSDECKNDVSLCYSYRKIIIPILARPAKLGYPPKGTEFALRGINFLDFSTMFNNPAKKITIGRKISDALAAGAVIVGTTLVPLAKNFKIKNVGNWTEEDVSHWLFHIGLSQYSADFKKKHINGRVLLSLNEKKLDSLNVMKLHQRRFIAAISDLFNGLNWNEDEVSEWMESVGLGELTQNLYDAHINGQSLLMLTKNDLQGNGITDPVTQKRILLEIQHLKETRAKVPFQDELYRFKVLRDVLRPIPTDAKEKSKFSAEVVELLKHIYEKSDPDNVGLTQSALKNFLLCLLIVAGIYHDTYATKNIWNDMNIVELLCMKDFAGTMFEDIDEIVTSIDAMVLQAKIGEANEALIEAMHNKLVAFLCFYYVILNNILQRLFAIIDRQVDGVVTWNELLPCLELIIHGSTDDKFKLAMSLVDFNGDGDISQQEFLDFYTECFLPVVRFCRLTNELKPDEVLDPNSFLYVAYEAVKDKVDTVPSLLNKNFSVEKTTGYLVEGYNKDYDALLELPWGNSPFVWHPYGYHPHDLEQKSKATYQTGSYICDACRTEQDGEVYTCVLCQFDLCPSCYAKRETGKVKNVDILVRYKNASFTLTNIAFGGKFNCPPVSLVKSALVWITEERPKLEDYSKFNNFTQADAEAYEGDDKPLFISVDPREKYIKYINLDKPALGKFVLIKLLDTHTEEELKKAKEDKKREKSVQAEIPKEEPEKPEGAIEENEEEKEKEEAKEDTEGANAEENKEAEGEEAKEEGEGEEEEEGDDDYLGDEEALELAKKCLVAEFIGLWGFDGRKGAQTSEASDAKKLFSTLLARYDTFGETESDNKTGENQFQIISKYVFEFLKSAKDFANGNEELSQPAKEIGIEKQEVEELLARLSYLSNMGAENPANILLLILPIIHLFRLFYGHNVYDILKKPM